MSVLDAFFDNTPEGKMARKLGVTKAEIEDIFAEFDEDASGSIDSVELQQFASSFGLIWDAETVEAALKEMDSDGNGTVDLKEFATWFCSRPDGSSEDTALKMKLQVKLAVRQITKALKDMRAARPGKECKNDFAVQIGEVDPEKSTGMIKFSVNPSNAESFGQFTPPEGAHCCVHTDFFLKDDASDEDIEKIKAGAAQAFSSFIEPMLAMIPPPPEVPGMAEGKPFHSYEIQKIDKKLRLVVFSGIDVASIYRDTGLDAGEYVPHFHAALYNGSPLSFLNDKSGCTLADLFAMRFEINFTWNTRVLHAAKAIASTKVVKGLMKEANPYGDNSMEIGLGMCSAMFKSQSSLFELEFNGFHEAMEAAILDVGFPMMEAAAQQQKAYDEEFAQFQKGYWGYTPIKLENKPSDEDVAELVKAVGAVSGKTFQYFRKEALTCGKLVPNPFFESDDWEMMQPCDPLYPAKHAVTNMIPEEMSFLKEVGFAFLNAVQGYSGHGFHGEIVHVDSEFRGLNWGHLLPTEAEIMAAECGEPINKQEFAVKAIGNDLMHPLGKYLYKEVATKVLEKGWVPAEAIPPPIKEQLDTYTVSDEEVAAFRDGLSEIFDILRISIRTLKRVDPEAPMLAQSPMPFPVKDALEFAIEAGEALVQ
jgi:hypothetical protein